MSTGEGALGRLERGVDAIAKVMPNTARMMALDLAEVRRALEGQGKPFAWMIVSPMLDRTFSFGPEKPALMGEERAVPLYVGPVVGVGT